MTTRPIGAIVIAAHNEELVIDRCLDALASVINDGSVQVIVVCNGCADRTAEIASRRAGVIVLELLVASKAAALRAGDVVAVPGPRIYLDADVVMTSRAALAVMASLRGGVLASRPPISFDARGSVWPVRRWYRIRGQLPSIQNVLWGAGTYGLAVEGRARFIEFPDIVSDDLFIDNLIAPSERAIVDTDPVVISAPRTSSDLLRILRRTYRTQSDVARHGAVNSVGVSATQRAQLADIGLLLRRRPAALFDAALYVVFIVIARTRAHLGRSSAAVPWERDESSRAGASI